MNDITGETSDGYHTFNEILAAATRYVHATQRDIVYDMERLARHVASQPSPDATSGRTDPEAPKGEPCPHGDPTCPCQDGDMCHYEGPAPMRCPRTGVVGCGE